MHIALFMLVRKWCTVCVNYGNKNLFYIICHESCFILYSPHTNLQQSNEVDRVRETGMPFCHCCIVLSSFGKFYYLVAICFNGVLSESSIVYFFTFRHWGLASPAVLIDTAVFCSFFFMYCMFALCFSSLFTWSSGVVDTMKAWSPHLSQPPAADVFDHQCVAFLKF